MIMSKNILAGVSIKGSGSNYIWNYFFTISIFYGAEVLKALNYFADESKTLLNHSKGTKEQFKALLAGINAIVPIELLKKQFDEKELELVITGLGEFRLL